MSDGMDRPEYWEEEPDPLGWNEWPSSTWDYNPGQFNGRAYMPYCHQISKKFVSGNQWGFDHSINSEDYSYLDGTTKIKSVLDNYLGYEGELVYKKDENGNIIVEKQTITYEDGTTQEIETKIIDREASTADEDASSPLSRRVYKTFNSYPKLLDFQNMSIDNTTIGVNTITYDEKSRETIDGITTIEVEPQFQIKNLSYKFDLAYLKVTSDSNYNQTQNIVYENDFTFSPLHYVYDITDFTLKGITSVPKTKTAKFKFVQEAVELMDKIGEKYYSVLYYDKTTGEEGELIFDKDTTFNSVSKIKESIYGIGNYKVQYTKNMPQLLTAYGKTRLYWQNETAYSYYGFFSVWMIPATVAFALMAPFFPIGTAAAIAAWGASLASAIATRRDLPAVSIGYQNRVNGDFFYNIGNKWEWIYRKNMGERLDLYDKFENPGFSMTKTNKNERAVKYNPIASPIWTNRDFGSNLKTKYNPYTGKNEAIGMQYMERPFIMNGFLESDFKNYGLTRFKGSMSNTEKSRMKVYGKAITHYDRYELENGGTLTFVNYNFGEYTDLGNNTLQRKYDEENDDGMLETKYQNIKYKSKSSWENSTNIDYFTDKYKIWNGENPQLTHIYEGQKFSLSYMLNNNFRRTTMLVKMAYDYCKYLCDINNIESSTRTITVQISSRLTINYFRKNLKLRRLYMTEADNIRIGKKYYAEFINDWLVLYNKTENRKIYFDFKTYIPDYKSHYGFNSGNNNIIVKTNLIPIFKRLYNGETLTESAYKSWNTFYKNNINEINYNGTFANTPKIDTDYDGAVDYMENFLRGYFGAMTDEELLQIYNEEMGLKGDKAKKNLVNTDYSSSNTLENKGELTRWINNSNTDDVTGNKVTENLMTNKIFNQQMWMNFVPANTDKTTYQQINGVGRYVFTSYRYPVLNNNHITYDIRNLCLLYQTELERILNHNAETLSEESAEKIQEKFYTYIDTELENAITKKDVLDLIISKCEDIIPKQDYFMTMSEFRAIKASTNKYKNYLDADNSNPNSLAYNLWTGYYVVPDSISETLKELITDGVTWETLLEKDGTISRGVNSNPMYISPFLPMYLDVYKKLPYLCKVFVRKYAYTYDILSETIAVMERDDWFSKKIVKFLKAWGKVWLIAAIVIVIAIVAFIPSGGSSAPITALVITAQILSVISAIAAVMALIMQCLAATSSNPNTQKRFKKAADVFNIISTVAGVGSAALNIANGFTEMAKQTAVSSLKIAFSCVQLAGFVGSTYHSAKGHSLDAAGWSILSLVGGIGNRLTGIKEAAAEAAKSGKDVIKPNYVMMSLQIINQLMTITNTIMESIYNSKLKDMSQEISLLEQKAKELEKELKEEQEALVQDGVNHNSVLWSKRPLAISDIIDAPDNLILSQTDIGSYLETNTDEIIEATFEVLES